ncbi:5'-nucleotidase [Aspergillus californicus]
MAQLTLNRDWPSNCEDLPACEIESPVETARRLARHLRVSEHCDLVISLTHMRVPEDMAVANATASGDSRVDLILGGHDHDVVRRYAGDTDVFAENLEQGRKISQIEADGMVPDAEGDIRLVKSGTDWKALSLIRLIVQKDEEGAVVGSQEVQQYTDIEAAIRTPQPPSPSTIEILDSIHGRVGKLAQKPLLHSAIPLDGRNSTIRSQETNMGNMLADAIRAFYDTDMGFFNSGAIRSDRILKATMPDGKPLNTDICPFENALVVKQLTGKIIWLSLENSVSDIKDGRFMQVSGLKVVASSQRPEGSRILEAFFKKPDGSFEPLDLSRTYAVAMPSFIARGYDDFDMFSTVEMSVGEEAAITDTRLLLSIFGHGEESTPEGSDMSEHAMGIERARALIVVGQSPDSLLIFR